MDKKESTSTIPSTKFEYSCIEFCFFSSRVEFTLFGLEFRIIIVFMVGVIVIGKVGRYVGNLEGIVEDILVGLVVGIGLSIVDGIIVGFVIGITVGIEVGIIVGFIVAVFF